MILRIGKRSQQQKNNGFTFIELVLVTIIILVLVGLSAPLFRRPFSNIQLKNTCQELVQLMRYAQTKAIAERKFCRINFDFAKGSFWLTVQDEASAGGFARIKGRWGKRFNLPAGISIVPLEGALMGEGVDYIVFYPDGSCDQTQIKISSNRGTSLTITTQKNVGHVKVEE